MNLALVYCEWKNTRKILERVNSQNMKKQVLVDSNTQYFMGNIQYLMVLEKTIKIRNRKEWRQS